MHRRPRSISLALTLAFTLTLAPCLFGRSFRAAGHYSVGSHPAAIVAGDFFSTGHIDLAIRNGDNTVSVLRGNGDGSFQPRVDYPLAAAPAAVLALLNSSQPHYASGSGLSSVVRADFNRDGLMDQAVISSSRDRVSILLGTNSPTPVEPTLKNLISNAGFETGSLFPWFQGRNFCSPPCKPWAVLSLQPRAGKFDAADIGNIELRQNFTATDISSITQVSFWIRHPTGNGLPTAYDFFYTDGTDDEFVVDTSDTNWDFFDVTSDLEPNKSLSGLSVFGFSGGGVEPGTMLDAVRVAAQ